MCDVYKHVAEETHFLLAFFFWLFLQVKQVVLIERII